MKLTFDRGTVTIDAPRSPRLDAVHTLRWDPRVACYRAPAFRHAALMAELRSSGIEIAEDIKREPAPSGDWSDIPLRPYQEAALCAWSRDRRGLLVLPTGSGKTRVACAAIAQVRAPALCLVPTRALMHQWCTEIAKHYAGRVGRLGDGHRELASITVATFESAYRGMPRFGDRFELLVVDEVHHFGSGVRDEALEMCAAPHRLGLTATAPEAEAQRRVTDLIGPCVCELGVRDLCGTWLAEFESVVLRLRLSADEQRQYDHARATFRRVYDRYRAAVSTGTWRDFATLAVRSAEGRAALAAFRASRRVTSYPESKRAAVGTLLRRHWEQRVLVFTSDNATAYAIAREHLIMPITCDIPRREREAALSAFRSGALRALVSAQVLNEGLDVPDAEVAIIVGGVRGRREHIQRVGRLLRPAPDKHAVVYDLVIHGTHETHAARLRNRALNVHEGHRD